MIGYLDEAIRTLVLILPNMIGYVKTFKVKDGGKDENNKLMSFSIDDERLLEKYKGKIKDLKKVKFNTLKTKIRTYGDKAYTDFRGLKNMT